MRRVTQIRTIGIAFGLCAGLVACGAIEGLGSPPFVSDDGPDGALDALSMPDVLDPDGGPDALADVATDAFDGAFDSSSDATPAEPDAAEAAAPDAADAAVLDANAPPACTWVFSGAGNLISSINQNDVQNVPAGVTPDGSTILFQRGNDTSACVDYLSLFISDEVSPGSGVYQPQEVTPPAGMDTGYEENVTITADGLTLIALNTTDTGFMMSSRSATGMVDFGAATVGDFPQIVATGSQTLWAPVISADGLAFYYVVRSDPTAAINGIYESVRASTSVPFPPGTRMPALVQSLAQYVTGLSADRMAILLEDGTVFDTAVLTRTSLSDAFSNPSQPGPPPALPGLRMKALDGCSRIIGSSGSGCSNELIYTWAQ